MSQSTFLHLPLTTIGSIEWGWMQFRVIALGHRLHALPLHFTLIVGSSSFATRHDVRGLSGVYLEWEMIGCSFRPSELG